MDFRHQIAAPSALANLAFDALVLIVVGEAVDPGLDPAVAALIDDAIALGDFQLKAGKTLYLHRVAGMQSPRLVVAASGAATPKAIKAAAVAALGQVKSLGA